VNKPTSSLSDSEYSNISSRLRRHVETLASLIGPRHMGLPTALDAAAAYVQRELAGTGAVVEAQTYDVKGQPATNFVVERPGTTKADEVVLLGAHYDSTPTTPGADDNASAVAVLIEAARLLHGREAKRTIRFVAFANEEEPHYWQGTMGSQAYARRCKARGEKIVGLLCLEMVGYFDTRPGSQKYPPGLPRWLTWFLPQRGDFIGMVANPKSVGLLLSARRGFKKAVKFPLVAVPLPQRIPEIRRSDHGPFWDEGLPALMITDTSFFRNPHYHMATDTPETLDYDRMARVTVGVAGAVAYTACGSPRVL